MKRIVKIVLSGILLLLTLGLARRADALTMAVQNLTDLMEGEVAFTGTCTAADSHLMKLPNSETELLVTTYTFSVTESLKGDVFGTYTFTQWGAPRVEARRLQRAYVEGMPAYEIGREYTVFLTCGSLGLCSTVGLGQGRFHVLESAEGKKQVVNDFGNKALLGRLPSGTSKALATAGVAPGTEGPIAYDSFVQLVHQLNQAQ